MEQGVTRKRRQNILAVKTETNLASQEGNY